jgi:hypothetical protein
MQVTRWSGRNKFGKTNRLRVSTMVGYEMFTHFRDTRADMRWSMSSHSKVQSCCDRRRKAGCSSWQQSASFSGSTCVLLVHCCTCGA